MAFFAPLLLAGLLKAGSQAPPEGPEAPGVVPGSRAGLPGVRSLPGKGGARLRLAGVAKRQRWNTDFYHLALYVDLEALRGRLPEGPDPEAIARILATGDVAHGYVTAFIREVGGHARLKFLQEALQRYWPPGSAFNPLTPSHQRFYAFFAKGLRRGDTTEVWLDGRGGILLHDPEGTLRLQDPALARAFAASYFGEPPRDPALMREVLKDVPDAVAKRPARN